MFGGVKQNRVGDRFFWLLAWICLRGVPYLTPAPISDSCSHDQHDFNTTSRRNVPQSKFLSRIQAKPANRYVIP